MMYGFFLYVISTVIMVFVYADAAGTPRTLPLLWDLGALMILVGGLWFFLFLRVNVAYDGDPALHVGRADLFVLSLIGSAAFALIWHLVQTRSDSDATSLLFFSIYLAFTTLLFGSVFWSKFAHMFYKPVVAFQRRHRVITAESVTRHTLFREETRWPGYYYRADHPKLNDPDWHVFTGSRFDAKTGEWQMSKLPVHHIVEGME